MLYNSTYEISGKDNFIETAELACLGLEVEIGISCKEVENSWENGGNIPQMDCGDSKFTTAELYTN